MFELTVPQNLIFDDEGLDNILNGNNCQEAKPADVLERWQAGDDLPPDHLDAVVKIVTRNPAKIRPADRTRLRGLLDWVRSEVVKEGDNNPNWVLQLASLNNAALHLDQAEQLYRQALDLRKWSLPLAPDERWLTMNHLADLLDQRGKALEARQMQALRDAEMALADVIHVDLVTVRSLALELLLVGDLETAERLYHGLLRRNFEVPGTLVHLARVLLMENRIPEARKAIAEASKLMRHHEVLQQAPTYVLPRILFFRILCAMLTRKNYALLVAQLKRELRENPDRELWTIAPVLLQVKDSLLPENLILLKALADALDAVEPPEILNTFLVWTTASESA